jgi:Polyketide cyclase / dehydrase and lipid transport
MYQMVQSPETQKRKVLEIDVTARSTADPATVYGLLADSSLWPTWAPLGSYELERPGQVTPCGLGAIRIFRTGTVTSREEIVELIPDRRLSYTLLSGLPLRGYRADIDLTPDGSGRDGSSRVGGGSDGSGSDGSGSDGSGSDGSGSDGSGPDGGSPGGGTLIRWHSRFTAAIPGTGWFYRWFLGRFIQRCVNGLAAHAAQATANRPG